MSKTDKLDQHINTEIVHLGADITERTSSRIIECGNRGKFSLTLQYETDNSNNDAEIINEIKATLISLILKNEEPKED